MRVGVVELGRTGRRGVLLGDGLQDGLFIEIQAEALAGHGDGGDGHAPANDAAHVAVGRALAAHRAVEDGEVFVEVEDDLDGAFVFDDLGVALGKVPGVFEEGPVATGNVDKREDEFIRDLMVRRRTGGQRQTVGRLT